MSLLINDGLVVKMHYTLKNADGETIDASTPEEPLAYLHGAGNIIPGLESALVGKVAGDKAEVTVAPEDAYGQPDPQMVQQAPLEAFQGVEKVEPGMAFQSQGPDGQPMMIMVTAVEDEMVTIDANHPLAGMTLTFSVEIVEVRDATEEEVAHGHVH